MGDATRKTGSRQIYLGRQAGRLSQDLTPQRKHTGIRSILLKNTRIAYHLGAHCIDKWNRWQLDPSLDIKTQSHNGMDRCNAVSVIKKMLLPASASETDKLPPAPLIMAQKKMSLGKSILDFMHFSPQATHIPQFSEKHDSKMWSQVKERRVNRERERAAEQASVSEGRSLSSRTGFPLGLSLFSLSRIKVIKDDVSTLNYQWVPT